MPQIFCCHLFRHFPFFSPHVLCPSKWCCTYGYGVAWCRSEYTCVQCEHIVKINRHQIHNEFVYIDRLIFVLFFFTFPFYLNLHCRLNWIVEWQFNSSILQFFDCPSFLCRRNMYRVECWTELFIWRIIVNWSLYVTTMYGIPNCVHIHNWRIIGFTIPSNDLTIANIVYATIRTADVIVKTQIYAHMNKSFKINRLTLKCWRFFIERCKSKTRRKKLKKSQQLQPQPSPKF